MHFSNHIAKQFKTTSFKKTMSIVSLTSLTFSQIFKNFHKNVKYLSEMFEIFEVLWQMWKIILLGVGWSWSQVSCPPVGIPPPPAAHSPPTMAPKKCTNANAIMRQLQEFGKKWNKYENVEKQTVSVCCVLCAVCWARRQWPNKWAKQVLYDRSLRHPTVIFGFFPESVLLFGHKKLRLFVACNLECKFCMLIWFRCQIGFFSVFCVLFPFFTARLALHLGLYCAFKTSIVESHCGCWACWAACLLPVVCYIVVIAI